MTDGNNRVNTPSVVVSISDGVLTIDGALDSIRAEKSYPVKVMLTPPQKKQKPKIRTPVSEPMPQLKGKIDRNENISTTSPLKVNEISLITLLDQTDESFEEVFKQSIQTHPPTVTKYSQSQMDDTTEADSFNDSVQELTPGDGIELPLPQPFHSLDSVDNKSYILSSDPAEVARNSQMAFSDPNKSSVANNNTSWLNDSSPELQLNFSNPNLNFNSNIHSDDNTLAPLPSAVFNYSDQGNVDKYSSVPSRVFKEGDVETSQEKSNLNYISDILNQSEFAYQFENPLSYMQTGIEDPDAPTVQNDNTNEVLYEIPSHVIGDNSNISYYSYVDTEVYHNSKTRGTDQYYTTVEDDINESTSTSPQETDLPIIESDAIDPPESTTTTDISVGSNKILQSDRSQYDGSQLVICTQTTDLPVVDYNAIGQPETITATEYGSFHPPALQRIEDIVRSDVDVTSLQADSPKSKEQEIEEVHISVLVESREEIFISRQVDSGSTVATQTSKFPKFVFPKSDVMKTSFAEFEKRFKQPNVSVAESTQTNPIVSHLFATSSSHPVTNSTLPRSESSLSSEFHDSDHKTCCVALLCFSLAGIALFVLGILGKLG